MARCWIIALSCATVLTGCSKVGTASGDRDAESSIEAGRVALVATAPDGTKLWGVRPGQRMRLVFFSSAGAQTSHSETCGKSCTRTIDDIVPSAPVER